MLAAAAWAAAAAAAAADRRLMDVNVKVGVETVKLVRVVMSCMPSLSRLCGG